MTDGTILIISLGVSTILYFVALHHSNMRKLAHRRIDELEQENRELSSKNDFHKRDVSHKSELYRKVLEQNGKLLKERDEAREVAERFRNKYLVLKEREESYLAADYMNKFYEKTKYKYQEEDQ
jgi:hypothetical protein